MYAILFVLFLGWRYFCIWNIICLFHWWFDNGLVFFGFLDGLHNGFIFLFSYCRQLIKCIHVYLNFSSIMIWPDWLWRLIFCIAYFFYTGTLINTEFFSQWKKKLPACKIPRERGHSKIPDQFVMQEKCGDLYMYCKYGAVVSSSIHHL